MVSTWPSLPRPPPPPPALALQSLHDGLCLTGTRPLRFDADCEPAFRADGADHGRRLLATAMAATPSPPPSGGKLHGGHLQVPLFLRFGRMGAHRELSPHDAPMFACADRWCFRCLSRGNANRARLGLCLFDGYEALRATPTPHRPFRGGGAMSLLGALLAPRAVLLLLLLVGLCLALVGLKQLVHTLRKVERARTSAISQLKKARVALRLSRDETRAPKLLSRLRAGGRFVEFRPRSANFAVAFPTGRHVLLRLDPERLEVDVFAAPPPPTASAASPSASGRASALYHGASGRTTPNHSLSPSGRASPRMAAAAARRSRSASPRSLFPDPSNAAAASASAASASAASASAAAASAASAASAAAASASAASAASSHRFLYSIPPQTIARMAFAKPDPASAAAQALLMSAYQNQRRFGSSAASAGGARSGAARWHTQSAPHDPTPPLLRWLLPAAFTWPWAAAAGGVPARPPSAAAGAAPGALARGGRGREGAASSAAVVPASSKASGMEGSRRSPPPGAEEADDGEEEEGEEEQPLITASAPWRCVSLEVTSGSFLGGFGDGPLTFGMPPPPPAVVTPFALRPSGELTGGTSHLTGGTGGFAHGGTAGRGAAPTAAASPPTEHSGSPNQNQGPTSPVRPGTISPMRGGTISPVRGGTSPSSMLGGGAAANGNGNGTGTGGGGDGTTRLVFAAESDDGALQWFLGLQEWLRTLGHLDTPARPAKLLWARARLRLAQRAMRTQTGSHAVLAKAVRVAASERAAALRV